MATPVTRRSRTSPQVPDEVRRSISGLGLLAAGANVVMQLSHLPVGHGVARSTVDSGRVDKHPLKRLRTTLSYLAVAMLGDDDDRLAMRRAVDSVHRHVRSAPTDPVAYNAFDPELQLWVAACLYKGLEDIHEILHGPFDPATAEVLYRHGSRLATTLQVTEAQWPADRVAFQAYWDEGVARIEMDDVTRPYLVGIAGAEFLGTPFAQVLGPINRFFTVGFLPPPFRDELGLPWDGRRQQLFDALMRVAAIGHRVVPQPLREFPFNAYLWDTRQRVRRGRSIV